MEKYDEILKLINDYASVMVGTLLKRIEVLEKEKALTPQLYKALVKENVYEQFRNLKRLVKVYLEVGTVTFKTRRKTT
jgi:hypothetical protein